MKNLNSDILNGFEVGAEQKAKKLLVFLHGVGASGSDLISLYKYFGYNDNSSSVYFLSPDAPFEFDGGFSGCYQWFSLGDMSYDVVLNGLEVGFPILEKFLVEQVERFGLNFSDIYLFGFSQGAILSLYANFMLKRKLGKIVAVSGALVLPHNANFDYGNIGDICLIHGKQDEVVPYVMMKKAVEFLKEKPVNLDYLAVNQLGHGINDEVIIHANKFLFG